MLTDNIEVLEGVVVDLPGVSELCPVHPGLGAARGLQPGPHDTHHLLLALQLPSHRPIPEIIMTVIMIEIMTPVNVPSLK